MNLLAIDTATTSAGVALLHAGQTLERQRKVTTHSEMLLPLIDEVLREAGLDVAALDAVVCGQGPGSFTGLRIGLSTAKGLCFALGCPLVLVSSLRALAARAPEGATVCATLDAYKAEVYAGLFHIVEGEPRPLGEELVLPPTDLAARLRSLSQPLWLVGDGALRYPELRVEGSTLVDEDGAPHAEEVARLGLRQLQAGEVARLGEAGPKYLRPSEAELKKNK